MTANDFSQHSFDDRDAQRSPQGDGGPALSPDDARVLDLLIDARFDLAALSALSAPDRARAERLVAQFGLLEAYPIDEDQGADADTLLDATMARIDRADRERSDRMRLDPVGSTSGRRGMRFPDLIAVASIAILAAVVLVPLLNWRNARAIDLKCENNLRLIAQGIESYTKTFDGAMPMSASILPDFAQEFGSWLGYRNADNLNVLKDGHYCSLGCLCCPGDHDPNGCYAYQVATGERRPRWQNGPTAAVVGDRNPLVDLKRDGETVKSVALNSASHGGRGQNLLFSDGAILFSSSPYLPLPGLPAGSGTGDNIWLPFGDRADSLLAPPGGGSGAGNGVDAFLLH